jgi:hypothetical protein
MATENEKKLEEQIKSLSEERKKIEAAILALKNQIESTEKKSVANLEKIIKLETLRLDSVEKEEEIRKKIEKIDKDTEKRTEKAKKAQDEATKGFEGQSDYTNDLQKSLKSVDSLMKDFSKTSFKTQAILSTLPADTQKNAANMGLTVNISEKFGKTIEKVKVYVQQTGTYTDDFKDSLSETVDLASDVEQMEAAMVKSSADAMKGKASIVETDRVREAILVKMYEIENGSSNLTREEKKLQMDALGVLMSKVDQMDVANEKIKEQNDSMANLNQMSNKVGDTMGGWVKRLPGGDNISNALGIDKTANNINKKMSTAFTSALGAIKGKNSPAEAFKDAGSALGSMISMAPKLMAGLGLGLLTGAVSFLMGAFGEVDQQVSDIGKEFGYSRKEAMGLRDTSIDIAGEMGVVGVNSKEVVKNIGTVSEMMGGLDIGAQLASGNAAAKQLVKDTTLLTEKFQMSADEVKSMHDLSAITGKSMGELAGTAAKMGGGLMTSKQAMKALAGVPKEVAVAFKGIPAQLAAAAQKAKLLGHDLKKVQDIGDGMLDIEQSLEKEMEARVLTGKNLQLDKARELALNGDIAGLQDELLKQAGGLEDFTKMNRIQQKAMADAMGMSVEEMTTMLTNADKLQKLGVSQQRMDELQSKNAEELKKIAGETADGALKAEIERMAKEKESASVKEKMANIVQKLQEKLSKLLTPILEMVHGMLDAAEAGGGFDEIIQSISGVIKGIIPIMKTVFSVFSSLIGPITSIFGFISNIGASTVQVKDAAGNLTGQVETVKSSFGGVLGVVTAIGGLFAGKALLGKGLDMLKEKASEFGDTIKEKVQDKIKDAAGDMGKKLLGMGGKKAKAPKTPKMPDGGGKKGGGFMDSLVEAFNKIDAKKMLMGAAAMVVLAAALWITAKAVQEFMKVDWAAMAKAGVALLGLAGIAYLMGKASTEMIKGAAAMLILGAALYVVGAALQLFGSIKWEDMAKAGVALLALVGVAALLGSFAPLFLVGAGVLGVLGVALMVFAGAMWVLGKAMSDVVPLMQAAFEGINSVITSIGDAIIGIVNAIAGGITTVIDKLMLVTNINPDNLGKIASGITDLGMALAGFGGGSGAGAIADGLGNALGGLLGGEGPLSQLQTIMKDIQPEKLSGIAKAIVELSAAMTALSNTLQNVNFDKLEEVMSAVDKASGGSKIGSIVSSIGSFFGGGGEEKGGASASPAKAGGISTVGQTAETVAVGGVGGAAGTSGAGGASAAGGGGGGLEGKMDQLISIISSMASSPTIIQIGDKTVEEINGRGDFKKTYQIGTDNSYGRSM